MKRSQLQFVYLRNVSVIFLIFFANIGKGSSQERIPSGCKLDGSPVQGGKTKLKRRSAPLSSPKDQSKRKREVVDRLIHELSTARSGDEESASGNGLDCSALEVYLSESRRLLDSPSSSEQESARARLGLIERLHESEELRRQLYESLQICKGRLQECEGKLQASQAEAHLLAQLLEVSKQESSVFVSSNIEITQQLNSLISVFNSIFGLTPEGVQHLLQTIPPQQPYIGLQPPVLSSLVGLCSNHPPQ